MYVDGASHTYGDELLFPETQAWPILLGNKLNMQTVNNAKKGKSNQHIIFDTINYCTRESPDLVIVAFAPISRKFFVRRENNYPVDISITNSNSIFNDKHEFKEFHNLLFKYWSNHLYDAWMFLQQIVMLQSFLKSQSIPYLLINSDDQKDIKNLLSISKQNTVIKNKLLDAFDQMNDTQVLAVEHQLNKLYQLIDHNNFYDFDWHFKKLIAFDYHPTAEQHVELANFILDILQ
jgi:UDP-glucose 6-dehydrogenase